MKVSNVWIRGNKRLSRVFAVPVVRTFTLLRLLSAYYARQLNVTLVKKSAGLERVTTDAAPFLVVYGWGQYCSFNFTRLPREKSLKQSVGIVPIPTYTGVQVRKMRKFRNHWKEGGGVKRFKMRFTRAKTFCSFRCVNFFFCFENWRRSRVEKNCRWLATCFSSHILRRLMTKVYHSVA